MVSAINASGVSSNANIPPEDIDKKDETQSIKEKIIEDIIITTISDEDDGPSEGSISINALIKVCKFAGKVGKKGWKVTKEFFKVYVFTKLINKAEEIEDKIKEDDNKKDSVQESPPDTSSSSESPKKDKGEENEPH